MVNNMRMKRFLWLLVATLCVTNALAIDQLGIAYRYNGKKQRTAIGGVYVKVATSPNGVVSNEPNGQFVLKLKGLGMGDPMGLATVTKKGMMVFNKEEVDRWSVQKKPLVLIVCDANEFQKQKDRLITIGRNQAEKRYKQKLAKLEAQNAKKQLSLDLYNAKLDSIEKEKSNALAHMDEYADLFARIDESEIDTIAQKAVDLFKQGYIDEAITLFKKNDPIAKIKKSVRIRKQAEEMRQLADSADALAQQDIDENMKNAKAYIAALKLKNDWEEAGRVLKELADALGTYEAIGEYAEFAHQQNQYAEAETYYKLCKDKIAILEKNNPEVYESRLAAICNNLGLIYSDTQRFDESEKMYKAAMEKFKQLADANPLAYESGLAASYNNLANLYSITQRFTESDKMYKTALEIYKPLADSNPQAYEPNLAKSYNNLACLYYTTKHFTESEKMHKAALEIYKPLADSNPQAYEPVLAHSFNNLAALYDDTQRFAESEQMHKAALEIRKRLADANPQAYEPDLADSYINLADLYNDTQRFTESEKMNKTALEIHKRLADTNPQAYEPTLASCYNNLAILYSNTQRYAESEQMFKAVLEIRKQLAESNPQAYEPALAKSYNNLANLYYKTQRYAESEQMYKAAITIYERLYEGAPQQYQSNLAIGCYWYGMSMIHNNKHLDAIGPFERSLKLCKDMMNDEADKSLYISNLECLVNLNSNPKDYATAYTYNQELLPLLKANYGEEADKWKTDYNGGLITQSFCANLLGKFEEGELHSLEALKVDSTHHLAYTNLAAAYLLQGKYQAAEKLYRQYKSEFKDGLLTDLDELAKAGVITADRKADVEKIKKMLNE
jgi:tetratricopeptide (TPR) repeat protein